MRFYGQPVNNLPPVKEVVTAYYTQYEAQDGVDTHVVFEKRKSGWFVVLNEWVQDELRPYKEYLFYSKEKGKYLDLPVYKISNFAEFNFSDYIFEYEQKMFDILPFYGYTGWYKDVVSELQGKKELSDTLLYSLGRAYSAHIYALLSQDWSHGVKKDQWSLPLSINSLDEGKIKIINHYGGKAQACFSKLVKRNPEFETTVGPIGIKYANEVMHQFHELLTFASDYAMKMKLPDSLYPEEMIKALREKMEACPRNAILISFGDNDFYPVYYLQHHLGVRKDLYLVSYSMLGFDRNIYRFSYDCFGSKRVKFSVDTSVYAGRNNSMFVLKDSSRTLSVADLINVIKSEKGNNVVGEIAVGYLSLPIQDRSTDSNENVAIQVKRRVSLSGVKYLYKNQWLLLDIIQNLDGRPICFMAPFGDELKGLNEFLVEIKGVWLYK